MPRFYETTLSITNLHNLSISTHVNRSRINMKASGNYAAITFFFNGKGFINYAAPLSDIGEADIKLSQLIEKLT